MKATTMLIAASFVALAGVAAVPMVSADSGIQQCQSQFGTDGYTACLENACPQNVTGIGVPPGAVQKVECLVVP